MKGLTDQSTTEYPSWDSSLQDHQGSHTEAVLNVIFGENTPQNGKGGGGSMLKEKINM